MSNPTLWWVLTGVLVAVELATGTFYLLMMALGAAAAATAAHAGLSFTGQMVVAAVIGAGAVTAWHVLRGKRPAAERASLNSDVNQDIGASVQVDAWSADGTAVVKYRGANWTVLADGGALEIGLHRVKEVVGSRLVVEKL